MAGVVLVVDDSSTVRQQLALVLEPEGYQIINAEDGEDGMQQVQRNQSIDLVISDMNMPRMNGLEMIRAVRKFNTAVPIIVLTTEAGIKQIEAAKAAGANGWIIKPFKKSALVAAVAKLIRRRAKTA